MAMYSACFDESGHPDDSDLLVVAGAVSSVDQWKEFEREWLNALAPFRTKIFHTVDFYRKSAPFDRMTRTERRKLIETLAEIIRNRTEKLFSFSLDMKGYRRINAEWVMDHAFAFPYPLAARSCIGCVEQWAHEQSIDLQEMLFFFEDGAKNKGQLKWIAERDKLPEPDFKSKSQLVPLQAADFIAWHLARVLGKKDTDGHPSAIVSLLELYPHKWREMNLRHGERIALALELPKRLPNYAYGHRVLTIKGARTCVMSARDKRDPRQGKLKRRELIVLEPKLKTLDDMKAALQEYDRGKTG